MSTAEAFDCSFISGSSGQKREGVRVADVNYFTVSRILGEWERQKVVQKSRGKVPIRGPEKLLAA
jgi:hypothetical protein